MLSNNQIAIVIERIEQMEDEKAAVALDISEIYKEAKGNGLDVKILKKIVAMRKKPQHEREREKTILDLYLAAVEGFEKTPLGEYAATVEIEI